MVLITSASQLLKTHSIEFDLKPVHLNIDSMASLLYRGEGNSSLVVALKMVRIQFNYIIINYNYIITINY